ncbi:MAG: (S)-ureidoglycine aminohydrolase [Vannielia sp.]|uniref:bifunctional allantoicase/(S)-ureidoglycine aminohydrolase n=1 Tax=Rhodobacterales TaxID=204455 RepID=UPI002095166D|nr:bifunctional allantoicase/(S)-ureidoglycine aminohydrolase [Oceanicola sp. 502str15]MCO6383162.1 (S)-ureidoglycine aminohydrolase [Oceanicola sp. 502str15]
MRTPYYARPPGGIPPQNQMLSDRAVFTNAYVVIPKGVQRDIVYSLLPHWRAAKFWILARPLSGFSETFSHYIAKIAPTGGTIRKEGEDGVQSALFLTHGIAEVEYGGKMVRMTPGSFVYLPPGARWSLRVRGERTATFHWIRKRYIEVDGIAPPAFFHRNENDVPHENMPCEGGEWSTTRFIDPDDLAFDFHVTIVNIDPGIAIPFAETHVMEHGLYVLQGKGVYRLNSDWVEVEAGDYMWLRAFCPQACYGGAPEQFRYLLYKDVNRHAALPPVPRF